MNNKRNKISAAQKTFSAYTKYITEEFLEKYGASYSNAESVKNTWRHKTPYYKEIEDFLIFKSKMFIRLLDTRDSNSTNPEFLKALIDLISDYLSAYTQKSSEKIKRKKAKEQLNRILYNQSAYIQTLLEKQAINRAKRNHRQTKYIRETRSKKSETQNALQNFNTTKKFIKVQSVEMCYIKNK